LPSLQSGAQWTISTAPGFLAANPDDPWKRYFTTKQLLAKAMKTLNWRPQAAK